MKLPVAKIELAAAQSESRYSINAVKLDVKAKRLIATDGHILACVPVEVLDTDHSGLIPLPAIKAIRAMGTKKLAANVECNGKISVDGIGQAATFEYGLGNFPNWEMVLPDAAIPATITLDFQLLNRLAQALGANSDQTAITLYVKDANSGVRVTCAANPEAVGVIMPRRQ